MSEPLYKYKSAEVGETIAGVYCGTLSLGIPSLFALGLIIVLVFVGVSSHTIEKVMVGLSVPWFAACYGLCKLMHETEIVFTDGNDKQH